MAIEWNQIIVIIVGILGAMLAYDWLKRRNSGSGLTAQERDRAAAPPTTIDEYVRRHYPNAV